MAASTPVKHAWRALLGLVIVIAVLAGINALGVYVYKQASWLPELALDLQGGTQMILQAKTPDGSPPTADQMKQASSIIRQRVDASGVGESDIQTQAGNQIVVQIPGPADDETRKRIEASAQLQLRAVLYTGAPATSFTGDDGKQTPYPTPAATLRATPTASPTNGSDMNWVTPKLQAQFLAYDCSDPHNDPADAPKSEPLITCESDGQAKYILGPVEQKTISGESVYLDGSLIDDASYGINSQNGQWEVNLKFDGKGKQIFTDVSTRLYGLEAPRNQFAFVLDGKVISAPRMNAVITDGNPSISGSFDEQSAKTLADQLKYGALPLSFTVVSSDTISATLGSQQLQIGLIAGLIGLALVAVYSLISYRALGFVIIASLAVMGVITYFMLCILAWRMGFRLSLAGVAGLIVTIAFTADSFIVYFERLRDELRAGRKLRSSVENAWKRARRTILVADAVTFLAALVLYFLAVGGVAGFAFAMGLTTLIDIVVVFFFTKPMVALLSRTKFFGRGHPMSGLDPRRLHKAAQDKAAAATARTTSQEA